MVNNSKIGNWLLASTVSVKLVIGLYFITYLPIDLDEPFSIFHAQKTLSELFTVFTTENNPPLHFILLHFWIKTFGISAFAVRSLSLIFSLLTVVVIWKIGVRFFQLKATGIVLFLFIFSDFHHYHSLEARTYALLVLLVAVLLYLLLKIMQDTTKISSVDFILIGVVNALLFYTHYIFLLLLLGQFSLLILYRKRFNWKQVGLSMVIFFTSITPWTPVILGRVQSVEEKGTWLPEAHYSELYGLINKFFNDRIAVVFLIISVLFLLFYTKLPLKKWVETNKSTLVPLLVLFTIPYFGAFALSKLTNADLFYDRYLFFLTLPLYFGIALFFSQRGKIFTYMFALFGGVYLWQFDLVPDSNRESDKLAEYVKSSGVSTIILTPDYYDLTFMYHYNPVLFKHVTLKQEESTHGIFAISTANSLDHFRLNDTLALVDADFQFVNQHENCKSWLEQKGYKSLENKRFKGNYTVELFAKKP